MITPTHESFLLEDVPTYIKNLSQVQKPSFGIMTPQHMVEHLIYVTKVTTKRYGEPDPKLQEHQVGMKKFILSDADFPKNVTPININAELKPLKYDSLEVAIDDLPKTIKKFYDFYKQNPDFKCYNPHMGELDFNLCERLHFKHYTHHLKQFGLIE